MASTAKAIENLNLNYAAKAVSQVLSNLRPVFRCSPVMLIDIYPGRFKFDQKKAADPGIFSKFHSNTVIR